MKNHGFLKILSLLLALLLVLSGCLDPSGLSGPTDPPSTPTQDVPTGSPTDTPSDPEQSFDLSSVPPYAEDAYVALNQNLPTFTRDQLTTNSYETYAPLDSLGRCGVAIACIGLDLMPSEERDEIGSVTPSGWKSVKYDHISGKYLYNRCHLIGFQLSGENANRSNLITGTRYLNIEGMLPFENMIADYVKETGNHVLYRVTPVFEGNNLVASGVQMEAYSVEDNEESICFNVYAYNVQPGVVIDYATGNSRLAGTEDAQPEQTEPPVDTGAAQDYVLNTSSKKFHKPDCTYAKNTSDTNRQTVTATRDALIAQGYDACGVCKP